jgi:hypothetical protein
MVGELSRLGIDRGHKTPLAALSREALLKEHGLAGVALFFTGIGHRIFSLETFPGDARHTRYRLADLGKDLGRPGIIPG